MYWLSTLPCGTTYFREFIFVLFCVMFAIVTDWFVLLGIHSCEFREVAFIWNYFIVFYVDVNNSNRVIRVILLQNTSCFVWVMVATRFYLWCLYVKHRQYRKFCGENFCKNIFCGHFFLWILEKTTKIRTHKKLVPHGTMPGTKYLISMEFDPLLYRLPIWPEYDVIELMIRKSHKIDSFVNTTVETSRLR